MTPTRKVNSIPTSECLAVALELSGKAWKIAFHDGKREKPSIRNVSTHTAAGRLEATVAEIERCKEKWGLPLEVRTVILYEAGQDGCWIQRALSKLGYEVIICDPASIPVERHARRAKTDRLDAIKLVMCLLAWLRGEFDRLHVNQVPSKEDEDERQLARERGVLQKEVLQHRDRILKLLRTVGCWPDDMMDAEDMMSRLEQGELRCHDGAPLPTRLQTRLQHECERMRFVERQFAQLEKDMVNNLPAPTRERIATLQRLKAIGSVGATRLVLELFWRNFDNRRQVGSCVGLAPQPYNSGGSETDQGISKRGNRRVRSLLIELAWLWLRYQPDSKLSKWFAQRTQGQHKRGKRIAIVAVARQLVIGLWRYLEHGVVPEGAVLKAFRPVGARAGKKNTLAIH